MYFASSINPFGGLFCIGSTIKDEASANDAVGIAPRCLPCAVLCTWSRVRRTSWGYVTQEATIFEEAEHARIVRELRGLPSSDAGEEDVSA